MRCNARLIDVETDNGTVLPELDSQRKTYIAKPDHCQFDIAQIHKNILFQFQQKI